ncbi:hypothetical protein AAFF_G00409370 [Aldrovandia affinis]|uniref:ribonuclease H n=1 Tax=Aldrovandia affinis TaxID=143900 RepID=A0AAD7SBF1_9TELE|nr:hypothetical protein AAFF_G00409370 [Aldrovandia affinis]
MGIQRHAVQSVQHPATFERLMEKVLQPVPAPACVVYRDDILVHASTYTAPLTNLRTVFELIAKANLCLNPEVQPLPQTDQLPGARRKRKGSVDQPGESRGSGKMAVANVNR